MLKDLKASNTPVSFVDSGHLLSALVCSTCLKHSVHLSPYTKQFNTIPRARFSKTRTRGNILKTAPRAPGGGGFSNRKGIDPSCDSIEVSSGPGSTKDSPGSGSEPGPGSSYEGGQ